MDTAAWTVIGTGIALAGIILVQGRSLRADFRERFTRLDEKVDGLAKDHNALARELSEVKGYLRGTLPESPRRPESAG